MVPEKIIEANAGHRICPRLHSQRDLIPLLTKKHIERIKHPAYDFNNVWGHTQSALRNRDGRTVECWWKPADERWVEMCAHFRSREILHKNLFLICQFVVCLPGTNAPVERIFSIMNNTWTDERNRLNVPTLKIRVKCLAQGHINTLGSWGSN